MAAVLEQLSEQLAQAPTDPDLIRRFAASCIDIGELARLRGALEPTWSALSGPLMVRPVAEALASSLVARARARSGEAPAEALELYLRVARLLATAANDRVGAAQALAEAWDVMPDERVPLLAQSLFAGTGEPPEYTLEALAEVGSPEQSSGALRRLAATELERRRLGRAEALFSRLIALVPDDVDAAEGLKVIADLRASASEEATQRSRALESASPAARKALLLELGEALRVSGRAADAEAAFAEGATLGDEGCLRALERLLRDEERLEDLAKTWQNLLPSLPRERQAALKRRLVVLLRDELRQSERAREVLETVEAPDAAISETPLAVALAFEEAASDAPQEEKLGLLKRALDALGDEPEAIRVAERLWRKVRALEPRDRDALAFFRAHYRRHPDPRKAYTNLAQLHASTEAPEERRALALEMAELSQSVVDATLAEGGVAARSAVERAIEAWRLIESDLLDAPRAPLASPPAELLHAWSELRSLYAATGRWHAYVDLLDRWVAREPDASVKIDLLFDAVAVYQDPERLPMPAMVLQTYQRIVALAPRETVALDQLAIGLAEREQWHDLLQVLGKKVEATEDVAELIGLFQQIADLYLDKVRSDSQAVTVLEHLLEVAPDDLEVVQKLRELYRRRADFERVFVTLERELELAEGDANAARGEVEILRELAQIAEEELLQPERAVALHRQILEAAPGDVAALDALQRLHAEREDWPAYVEVLEQRVAETRAKAQKLPLLLELGETVLTRLLDVEKAEQIFATIAESSPTSATARRFLQKIFVSRQKWEELSRLFLRSASRSPAPAPNALWKDYVDFLEDAVRHEAQPPLAAAIHVELARVFELELEDKVAAANHLEQALAVAEDQVELARRHRVLLGEEAAGRLVPLTTLARHSPEPTERMQAWLAIGHLRRKSKDLGQAMEAWGRALITGAHGVGVLEIEDPELALLEVIELLEADAAATGRWEEAKAALDEALSHVPAEALRLRVGMHRLLGSIARARLQQTDDAIRHLKWVLQLAPGDAEALEELEKLYFSNNDFTGLEDVFRARIDSAESVEARVEALERLARLYDDVVMDPEQAAEAWQAILRLAPEDQSAQAALLSALERAGLDAELAGALEAAVVRTAAPGDRNTFQLRLMELWANQLGDPEAAVDHAAELVDRLPPGSEALARVTALLERYARVDAGGAGIEVRGALAALEVAYRRESRLGSLYGLLERRTASASEDELPAIYDELAMLAEAHLGSPERALTALKRRMTLRPADPEVWAEVERLAEPLNAWEDVVELFKAAVANPRLPAERRPTLRLRLAEVYHRRLIELDDAIQETERALAESQQPEEQLRALECLEVLFKKSADLENFVRVKIEASGRVLSRTRKREKLIEAAAALAGALGRPAEAVALLEPLWLDSPGDSELVDTLLTLVERQGEHHRADELYGDAIEAAPLPARKDALRLRRALHRRDRLELWEVAISELIDLVASEHVGREARRTLLEICRAQESEAQRDVILEVLVDHYRATADAEGLINALVVQAEFAEPGEARASALIAAAQACVPALERLVAMAPEAPGREALVAEIAARPEEAQQAFDLWVQALFEFPEGMDEAQLLAHMQALAVATGTELELAEALTTVASTLVPSSEAASTTAAVVYARRMWREAGALLESLGATDRAVDAWEGELALADGRGDTDVAEALSALDRLHKAADRPEPRREALVRLAVALEAPVARAEAYERLAGLELELGRTHEAAAALDMALGEVEAAAGAERDAVRQRLLGALEGVLVRDARYEELIERLLEASEAEHDAPVQRELLLRAAELAADQLGEPARAAAIYERLTALDATDEFALSQLVELDTQLGRWDGVIAALGHLRALAVQAGARRETAALDYRIGAIELEQLGAHDRARAAFAAALVNEPAHEGALAGLLQLEAAGADAGAARELMANAHRASGDHAALAEVLARIVESDVETAALQLELAELWLGPLSSPEKAWEPLQRGYALDPQGDVGAKCREHLLALGSAQAEPARGAWQERLVATLAGVAEALSGAERRARKEADLTDLTRAGLDEAALVPAWRALARELPPPAEVVAKMERHAEATGDAALLADALQARLVGLDGEARLEVELALAEALTRIEDRRGEAAEVLFAARQRSPHSEVATDRLAALLDELGRPAERAEVLADALELTAGSAAPARVEHLRLELAEAAWRHLAQPAISVDLLAAVLAAKGERAPDAIALLEQLWAEGAERKSIHALLEPAYRDSERWDKLVALYTSSMETDDAALQFECLTKLAALQRDRLASPEASFTTMLALLDRTEDDAPRLAELLDDLDRTAGALGRWRELAERLEAMIGLGRGGPALMGRLARLYEDHGDDERAANFYGFAFGRAAEDHESRDALARVLERSERWADLALHHARAADLLPVDAPERLDLLQRAAKLHESRLAQPEEALAYYQRVVVEAAPESEIALACHERIAAIYEAAEDHESLHYHLRSWLSEVTDPALSANVRTRLGRSLVRFPELAAEGLLELEEVLRGDPTRADVLEALGAMVLRAAAEEAEQTLDPSLAVATAGAAGLLEGALEGGAPVDLSKLWVEGTRDLEARRTATVLALVEAQLRVEPDGAARQAMLKRMADLTLALGEDERAFAYLAEALRGEPALAELEQALESLATRGRFWESLASVYEELATHEASEVAGHYDLKLAQALHHELDRMSEAAGWYERHLEHAPHRREAVEPLLSYYGESGEPASEARILELLIDHAATADELPGLRKRLGILRMDQLGDVQGAIDAFEGCLPDGAADPDLVKRLERLYARGEHYAAMLTLYRGVLDLAANDKERLETLAKMTQVYEVRQHDLQSARETGRRMLAIDPTSRFALTSLERIERNLGDWEAVDELLGQKFALAPSDEARVRVLIDRAEVAQTHREAPEQALEYLLSADRLVGPGPGPDELVRGLQALLKSEPKLRVHAARALVRRYRARQAWQEAVNSAMIELMVTEDHGEQVALAQQVQELAVDRLGNPLMALRLLVTALRQAPQAGEIRAMVTRLAEDQGDFALVLKAGEDIMKRGLAAEAMDGFARWLGGIQVAVGQVERAIQSYERVLEVAPADPEVGDTLASLYHARADWSSLRGLYRHRRTVTPAAEHARLDLDLALYLTPVEGVEATRRVVDALVEAGDAQLVARLQARVDEPAAGEVATAVLAERLRGPKDAKALVELLSRRAAATPNQVEAARLLGDAAAVAEAGLRDPRLAVDLLGRAALATPEAQMTWEALHAAAMRAELWQELAARLASGLEVCSPEIGRTLALWLAELEAERLGLADGLVRAVSTLRGASDRLPGDIELRRKLITYEVSRGDLAAVEEEVTALTELLDDSERERKYWRVLRRLAEQRGDEVRLVVANEAILAREPADTEAADHLAAFYRKRARWEDLAELLILRVEAAATPEAAAGYWAEIASLRMGPLADSDGAFFAWEQAQDLDPAHAEATRKLAQLYSERGEWGEVGALWVEHAEAMTALAAEARSEEIAAAWIEAARVFEDRTRNLEEAALAYENALAADPGALAALTALIGLHQRARRYPELAHALERKAAALPKAAEQITALVQAAGIHLEQLRDLPNAERLVAEALALDGEHVEARLMLARLHVRQERPLDALRTLEAIALRSEGKRKVRLLMDIARLRLELELVVEALAAVDEALALEPDAAGLDALAVDTYGRAERWDDLVAILEAAFARAKTPAERRDRALALARIWVGPRSDLDRFERWVAEARAADPEDEVAIACEVDALIGRERLDEAEALLSQLVERLEQRRAAEELLARCHQLGKLRLRLNRVPEALAAFARAHDINGKDVANLLEYGRALVLAKRWAEALVIHQALLLQRQGIEDEAERLAVLERIALASWEANQKDRAKAYLNRLLSESPDHPGGLALKARFTA